MIARFALILAASLTLAGCNQGKRDKAARGLEQPPDQALTVALVPLSPGGTPPMTQSTAKGEDYAKDPQKIADGKRLFTQMNCVGCHSHGGGSMGPPLAKPHPEWIYGDAIENIVSTVREGRPNGMPSFRGKIPDDQIWEIAAYVHSLSGTAPEQVGE
ncbi:MAG: c-type cytochrome [Beijerinckiaceae bacterium]